MKKEKKDLIENKDYVLLNAGGHGIHWVGKFSNKDHDGYYIFKIKNNDDVELCFLKDRERITEK